MKYLVWLTCKLKFSQKTRKYLEKFSAEEIWRMSFDELEKNALPDALADKSLERAERILKICKAKGITLISCDSADYPECMKKRDKMPALIYVKGDINILKQGLRVGFVGTRNTTPYGEACASALAEKLARKDCVIISGGARGIDTAALRAALRARKGAVAVLGCDIDVYFPSENYSLFTIIAEKGLIISEYPPETSAHYFPARNRIIAALSERLAVCEAPEKSGALITAQYASDIGVPVFAYVSSESSFAGCRALVERGAHLMTDTDAVIECNIPTPLKKITKTKQTSPAVISEEKNPVKKTGIPLHDYIIDCILDGRDTVNKMLNGNFRINEILCALTCLELDGVIVSLPGDRYKLI